MRHDARVQDVVIDGVGYRLGTLQEFRVLLRVQSQSLKGIALVDVTTTPARLAQETSGKLVRSGQTLRIVTPWASRRRETPQETAYGTA